MRKRMLTYIISAALVFANLAGAAPVYVYAAENTAQVPAAHETTVTPVDDIPEEDLPEVKQEHDTSSVIAKLDKNISLDELNNDLKKVDSIVPTTITEDDIAMNYICLTLSPGVAVEQAMVQLSKLPGITQAVPNLIYHFNDDPDSGSVVLPEAYAGTASVPNDPILNDYDSSWMHKAIDVYDAWDLQKTDKNITVAVIDALTDLNHEDLKDNIVGYRDLSGLGWDLSTEDPPNHGTHVSGIIAARANNGAGTAGISYNAGLFPIRVADQNGASELSTLIKGFQCVLDNKDTYNIRVVNFSMAVNIIDHHSYRSMDPDPYSLIMIDCINSLYSSGILTVIASGNFVPEANGSYCSYPGDYCGTAISVIALAGPTGRAAPTESETDSLTRAYFSNYNNSGERSKNISAPGYHICSCANSDKYGLLNGTSQATPCISGVASLVFAYDPGLSAVQAKDILYSSAKDLGAPGWDEEYGFGCVNAKNALEYAMTGLYYSESVSETFTGSSFTLTPKRPGAYTWISDDTSIATVSNGVVNTKKAGIVTITAIGSDQKKISREIAVLDEPFSKPLSIMKGSTTTLNCKTCSAQGYYWSYSVNDPSILSMEFGEKTEVQNDPFITKDDLNALMLTGQKAGTTTLTATCCGLTHTVTVNVTADETADTKELNVKVTGLRQKTYSGLPQTQKPTVKLGKKKLKENKDYILSYENNINSGTATMIITGKGQYSGVKRVAFKINPKSASGAKVYYVKSYTYSGEATTPAPTVKLKKQTLLPGRDYTLSYKKNVNAGKASMIVSFTGNYKGKKTLSFKIKKMANPLDVTGKDINVSTAAITDKYITLPASDILTVNNAGIGKLKLTKSSGNSLIKADTKTGNLVIKQGIAPGTYPVKLRVTAAGNKNYNKKTLTVTVNVLVQ